MSLKIILVMPAFLIIANATAAEAADNRSYAGSHALYQDVTIPQGPGPLPIPYPNAIAAGQQGGTHGGGILVGMGDGSVRQGITDGTSNTLMAGEKHVSPSGSPSGPQNYGAVAPPSSPSGPQRYLDVPPSSGAPTGGNQGWGRWETNPGKLTSLNGLKNSNELFANSKGGDQGSQHPGGANFVFADGSVRSVGDAPAAGDGELANPTGGGTKLPAVQKVRDAAVRAGGEAQRSPMTAFGTGQGAAPSYHNPQSFQILGAGKDGAGASAGPGAGPHVKVFSGQNGLNAGNAANAAKSTAGAKVK